MRRSRAREAVEILEELPPGRELAAAYNKRAFLAVCGARIDEGREWSQRALAIAELPKDPKASPRLIPIAIRDKGRFFDASVYNLVRGYQGAARLASRLAS